MSRITEAERQTARFSLLTPAQVAERLDGVSADTVRHWCAGGWLRHVDIRRPGARSATYLIDAAWVEAFIAKGGARAFVSGEVRPFWWEGKAA
jgi:hypothetical protein